MRPIPQIAGAALLAALVPGFTAAPVRADAPADPPTESAAAGPGERDLLLDMIVAWLSSNFDLPAVADNPAVVFTSPERLVALRYGPDARFDPDDIVAVYKDDEETIYLREEWNGRTPGDLSVMVHEMVHHLQNAGAMRFACPAEREVLAYQAQEEWLGLFGRSLAGEFGIDKGMLMLATVCTY